MHVMSTRTVFRVNSDKVITNLYFSSDVIIDAPVSVVLKYYSHMCNKYGELEDTSFFSCLKCIIIPLINNTFLL